MAACPPPPPCSPASGEHGGGGEGRTTPTARIHDRTLDCHPRVSWPRLVRILQFRPPDPSAPSRRGTVSPVPNTDQRGLTPAVSSDPCHPGWSASFGPLVAAVRADVRPAPAPEDLS